MEKKILARTLEIQTMEELAELQQAISKVYRYGCNGEYKENLIEELSDASTMMRLLTYEYFKSKHFTVDDIEKIENICLKKIERMKERIENDKEGRL